MAIKMKIGDVEISVDTGAEVRDVLTAMGHSIPTPGIERRRKTVMVTARIKHPSQIARSDEQGTPPPEDLREARKFIRVIGTTPGEPVRGAKIAETFGLEHPKAVGPLSAHVRGTLRALGFDPDEVYFSRKIENVRWWHSGDKYAEAMKLITERLEVS